VHRLGDGPSRFEGIQSWRVVGGWREASGWFQRAVPIFERLGASPSRERAIEEFCRGLSLGLIVTIG